MKLYAMLAFIPLALAFRAVGADPILIFAASAMAMLPLADLTGKATDALASYVGPTWGGLLNASLGNAPEIIISYFALRQGLVDVVKSAVVGSIIGNLLLGLGLSMFAGGLRHGTQTYNRRVAGMNAALLTLAAAGLIIPATFHHSSPEITREISAEISVILFLVYLGSLIYTLTTSRPAIGKSVVEAEVESMSEPIGGEAGWSRNRAIAILAVVACGLALMSEVLTDAIEPASAMLGLTPIFTGIFLLAPAGNIAEMFNAAGFARSGKMDLALGVTVGSSIQIALVVAPVLVFSGFMLGQPMDLVFSQFEIAAIVLSVLVARQLIDDGQSNWLDGLMLIGVYLMLGVGFYYLPGASKPGF